MLFVLLAGCGNCGSRLRPTSADVRVGSEVNLGRPFVGDRAEASFSIAATSDGVIRVLSVTTAHPQLVLDWQPPPGGVQLARGASMDVKVSWTPTEPGLLDATIEVQLDFEKAPHHTVHVSGEGRAIPSCDDGNQCTDDAFSKSTEQCVHAFHNRACDDGNACTEDDQCQAGVCRGVGKTCNDDNVCTLDLCDPVSGCVFPPDGRQCDDKDPCTTDLCDPDDGCSHEGATGPSCGDISCATAHICVAGTCRNLDIRGSSDGFPCSDGNVCTENDTCLAGQCAPGPIRASGPEIVARLDTYGGEYGYVATDGFRYLFVDRQFVATDDSSLRVAIPDSNGLQPKGALRTTAGATPVAIGPGLFLVPLVGRLTLVNATDADHPSIVSEHFVHLDGRGAFAKGLFKVYGGIVVWAQFTGTATTPSQEWLLFAPTTPSGSVGPWQLLVEVERISDVDAADDWLIMSGSAGTIWLQFDATGKINASIPIEPLVGAVNKVSVEGTVVATQYGQRIRLFSVDPHSRQPVVCNASDPNCRLTRPGCDGTFPFPMGPYLACAATGTGCPTDTTCELVSVQDDSPASGVCQEACCEAKVGMCLKAAPRTKDLGTLNAQQLFDLQLLQPSGSPGGPRLYWSTETGLFGIPVSEVTAAGVVAQGAQHRVDGSSLSTLARATDHLLVSGRVTVPMKFEQNVQTQQLQLRRMVGPGMGEVSAIADALGHAVALGGPMVVGELDLNQKTFKNWQLTDSPSRGYTPRLLKGATQIVPIEIFSQESAPLAAPCERTLLNVTDATGAMTLLQPCFFFSGQITSMMGRLWALTNSAATDPTLGLKVTRSWSLDPFSPQPETYSVDDTSRISRSVRASADGLSVVRLESDGRSVASVSNVRAFIHEADRTKVREAVLDPDPAAAPRSYYSANTDGTSLMSIVNGVVRLHPIGPLVSGTVGPKSPDPLPSVTLFENGLPQGNFDVLWMKDGRAWVGWMSADVVNPAYRLSEFRYDAQTHALSLEGSVKLNGYARAVTSAAGYTVAASRTEVVVVAPACR
jgi:hypothetical protein